MVDAEIGFPGDSIPEKPAAVDQAAADEALNEILEMIGSAERPIIIAGAEVHRFNLQPLFEKFLKRSRLPFVTTVLSKSLISEDHPQYVGVYAGGMSPDDVREAVENSDCIISIGHLMTDLATGLFTHHIDIGQSVVLSPEGVSVRHHLYPRISMGYFLEILNNSISPPQNPPVQPGKHRIEPFFPRPGKQVTVNRLIACVNTYLNDSTTVIAEPGDPLFGSLDLTIHGMTDFLSPAYYASIGFAVPASIGVQLAAPDRRPLILVGDGSFQMTGMELSVSVRYKLNPIVIILNNGGYGTFRPMIDGPFNDIPPWKYAEIGRVIGRVRGLTVSTEDELSAALNSAGKDTSRPTIIDVRLEKNDYSERLKYLTDNLKNRIR